ncbi:MAG: hypothetical protein ABI037_02035 [Gemmatimonadales bacterium]
MESRTSLLVLTALSIPMASALAQQHEEMEMHMQPGADRMRVSVQSPTNGSKITGDKVTLQLAATGFQERCDLAGKPNKPGTGHYHILLDKSLVDMHCGNKATVSLEGVKAGPHTLTVVPAQNDHTEVEHNANSVEIQYVPTGPKPPETRAAHTGAPWIKILSPKPGETVSGSFDLKIGVKNFDLTCAEMGKPGVPGHGHWHLNFDTMKGPMMGMMTMAAMSCDQTLHVSTAGLKPGSSHKLIALLADNVHAPLMPAVADSVEVKVK